MESLSRQKRRQRMALFFAALATVVLYFALESLYRQYLKFRDLSRRQQHLHYTRQALRLLRTLQDERDGGLWLLSHPGEKEPKLLLPRLRAHTDETFESYNRFLWSHPLWQESPEIKAFLSGYAHLANTRLALDEGALTGEELIERYRRLLDRLLYTATESREAPSPRMNRTADTLRELLWLIDIRAMERSLLLQLKSDGETRSRLIRQLRRLQGRLEEHLKRYWLHQVGDLPPGILSPLVEPDLEERYRDIKKRMTRLLEITSAHRQSWWDLSREYLEALTRLGDRHLEDLLQENARKLKSQKGFLLLSILLLVVALLLLLWGYRAGVRRIPLLSAADPQRNTVASSAPTVTDTLPHPVDEKPQPSQGLLSRSAFLERLYECYHISRESDRIHALIYLSLSHRPESQNTDAETFLEEMSRRLAEMELPVPLAVTRIEPETLGILLTNLKTQRSRAVREITLIVEQIRTLLERPIEPEESTPPHKVHLGIKLFPNTEERWEEVLTHAAAAMERSRNTPQEPFCLYDDYMDLEFKRFLRLKEEFSHALKHDELVLHYQPRVSLTTNRIVGMEALVRWRHPHRGLIQPTEFLYLSAGTPMAWELDRYVLEEVCRQTRAWQERFANFDLKISLNLTGHTLTRPEALEWSLEFLSASRELASQLEFEISQETLFQDLEQTTKAMESFKELGVCFCLDNFGTGYSSIEYLRRLPVDIVKIDRSFILDLHDYHSREVVKLMIKTAEIFGLETVAEGVERPQTLEFLRSTGCTYYQGFHCTAPLSPQEMEEFLRHQSRCEERE